MLDAASNHDRIRAGLWVSPRASDAERTAKALALAGEPGVSALKLSFLLGGHPADPECRPQLDRIFDAARLHDLVVHVHTSPGTASDIDHVGQLVDASADQVAIHLVHFGGGMSGHIKLAGSRFFDWIAAGKQVYTDLSWAIGFAAGWLAQEISRRGIGHDRGGGGRGPAGRDPPDGDDHGTTAGPDRGARNLVRCVRAVLAAVPGLPIQVQIEPPGDLSLITDLYEAGATAIGIHVESLDDEVRKRWMPGKSTVPLSEYEAAWDAAVRVFGRNRVSTYLLIGLGDDPDELVAGAASLIERGVYPFVVPFRPMLDTLARRDGISGPSTALVQQITERVAALLRAAGMAGADQGAGCAACGACGVLQAAGG